MTLLATELPSRTPMSTAARARFAATSEASVAFFTTHSERVSRACHAMAQRFQAGGRLLIHGEGARRSDVSHVVVEFMHPVVVGKRALASLALADAGSGDPSATLHRLNVIGRESDIFMLLTDRTLTASEQSLIARADSMGMLTIALTGAEPATDLPVPARFAFPVPSADACIVQETHEMLYHILWELVHVFLEHRTATE